MVLNYLYSDLIHFLHLILLVQKLFHPIVNLVVQVCKMILSRQNDGWKMTQPCITLSSSSVRQLNFTEKKVSNFIACNRILRLSFKSTKINYSTNMFFFVGRWKYVTFKVGKYEMELLITMFSCSKLYHILISQKNANPPVKAGNEKKPDWLKMCRTILFLTT